MTKSYVIYSLLGNSSVIQIPLSGDVIVHIVHVHVQYVLLQIPDIQFYVLSLTDLRLCYYMYMYMYSILHD